MKVNIPFFFLPLFFLVSGEALALIHLDVVLIHKKGIDKDLILVSEIQSTERIFGKEIVQLNLKNEIRLTFQTEFVEDSSYGPSALVAISGQVTNAAKERLMHFVPSKAKISLNEEKVFSYQSEDQDQMIEVRLRPYLE